ncbi:hypothetical protein [Rhodococcus sp. ARC_M6]|uniref:hypothetical protein n=1 Tax=Rhodococcus sp. ARC_M6 TaxID=2928852 RepID=UPI001FB3340D|nr:hypothetical protein [Rhodococcus sp. ARC_M6]MCJ0903656.1 hypothetical protein [Rhodococcus sp. ARC_M6]
MLGWVGNPGGSAAVRVPGRNIGDDQLVVIESVMDLVAGMGQLLSHELGAIPHPG